MGTTDRTVKALTWRIGLSIALIAAGRKKLLKQAESARKSTEKWSVRARWIYRRTYPPSRPTDKQDRALEAQAYAIYTNAETI